MDGPIVGLQLHSRPQTLTIVRGMLAGVAELLGMDPELLDDLKTSVSEACNNVVLHAYDGDAGPMKVKLYVDDDSIHVTVQDEGVGLTPSAAAHDATAGIGVSVIRALTREARFEPRPGGGTEVLMEFAGRRDDRRLFQSPGPAAADVPLGPVKEGEVALSLSPVSLSTAVLGRLARTLAATAHFSLDRFSDVYLITDTLAAHATGAAAAHRISARMIAAERQLELVVGPFRRGTGSQLQAGAPDRLSSPLALLADEVSVQDAGDAELVTVVVRDHRA